MPRTEGDTVSKIQQPKPLIAPSIAKPGTMKPPTVKPHRP
jgi:hypothetical protein